MNYEFWNSEREDYLKLNYALKISKDLALEMGCTVFMIKNRAFKLGLKKPNPTRFKIGEVAWNIGKKQSDYMSLEAIEKTKFSRFKKGNAPKNSKFDGHERKDKDGFTLVRVSKGKYVMKNRHIWSLNYGEIPKGHVVVFKDGNRNNFDIDNLALKSWSKNMAINKDKDKFIATLLSKKKGMKGKIDKELQLEILNYPELLDLKRKQLTLNKLINESIG